MKLEFSRHSKNTQISNFMKILQVGAELFHADGRTDTFDEAESRFCNFANAPNAFREGPIDLWTVICRRSYTQILIIKLSGLPIRSYATYYKTITPPQIQLYIEFEYSFLNLCSVDRAPLYNLVKEINLVHNILSILSILFITSTCFGPLQVHHQEE